MLKQRKIWISLLIVCILQTTILLPNTVLAAEYEDFSNIQSYESKAIEQLIDVYAYDENYDQQAAQQMINRIGKIPEEIIQATLDKGVKLYLVDFPIIEHEAFAHLKGEHPRGHPDDAVWDHVPGAGGNETIARIGYSEPGNDHGTKNLELHEYGHGIEYALFNGDIDRDESFHEAFTEERESMFPSDEYFEYPAEYFAEVVSYFYLDDTAANELKNKAPKTYAFLEDMPKRMLSLEDTDEPGISLSWDEIKDASIYHIYRSGELIDSVDEPTYLDDTFESYFTYDYIVEAENEAGEIVFTSFPRTIDTEENTAIVINDIDDIEILEATDQMITLGWEYVVTADFYEIYRDDQFIGETYDNRYEDFVYASDREFTYEVVAKKSNGGEKAFTPITARTDVATTAEEDPFLNDPSGDEGFFTVEVINLILIGIVLLIILGVFAVIGLVIYLLVRQKKQSNHEKEE